MTKRGDRYFDGYQRITLRDADGVEHRELRYMAEWYGYEEHGMLKRRKAEAAALTAVIILFYLYAQLHPALIGMLRYMAIPSLLSLVPMIFLVMGLLNFLLAKEKWELHTYYAGYRRLFRAAVGQLMLLTIWIAMDLVYICTIPGLILMDELEYLLCGLISTGAAAALVVLLRKNPPQVVEGPTIR